MFVLEDEMTLIVVVLSLIISISAENIIVNLKQGPLKGIESKSSVNGVKYFSFLGIPYAKPPVGNLRFKAPVPADKWEGTWDATKERDVCIQAVPATNFTLKGSEDCLYLNVFSPQAPSEIKIPKAVMVWIHGGGFIDGSGSRNFSGPDYLMNYDVILVTLNYRLNAFGFFFLGTFDAPGNYGLKDQSMALKWVNENIQSFGGDPQKITIFGQSAGGASVHLHTLSPLSKGLFQRAIIQSAHALNSWTINPQALASAISLLSLLNFQGNGFDEMLKFMRAQPADAIMEKVYEMNFGSPSARDSAYLAFAPVVEPNPENAFLPDWPVNLLSNVNPIPLMIGFAENEGSVHLMFKEKTIYNLYEDLIRDTNFIFKEVDENRREPVMAKLKMFYIGDKNWSEGTKHEYSKFWHDTFLLRFYKSIEANSKSNAPPYIYQFSYKGSLNKWQKILPVEDSDFNDTTHGEELGYLFHIRRNFPKSEPIEISPDDLKMIHYMCSFWTNFAKTGNPSFEMPVNWTPSTTNVPTFMKIAIHPQMVSGRIDERSMSFWDEMLKSENVTHYL